jgi:hypothetical protein
LRHGTCKLNIKNHINEKDPVENRNKMAQSNILSNLGELNNGQVWSTLKTSTCAGFFIIATSKYSENRLVFKSEKFLKFALKLKKLWPK